MSIDVKLWKFVANFAVMCERLRCLNVVSHLLNGEML